MDCSISQAHSTIVSQVAQYVFDHSEEKVSLEELANYTGYSKYHFNRIFAAATGFQLGDFIQRQKLEKAMHLIKQGNKSILEVALITGYDSPSSFSRAFKKNFGITPRQANQGLLPNTPRAGILAPKHSEFSRVLEPQLLTLPKQTILGLYGKGFDQQSFSRIAAELYKQLTDMALPLTFEQLKPIGVSIDNPWVGEQTQSTFFAGFTHGLNADHRLEEFAWQAGQWACFTHIGSHATMWQTISQVYAQWVLPNNIKLKDQQIVQRYINNPLQTPEESLLTKLYFAIENPESP
ncbi:AraC family transcriptional regulator [Thalassotalea loyana]|uniref:AraC family transcriptional regulator n=1 Tax=Thalassotalea loyana TaxID=280483 RepID=A0ABQ6H8X5_9GAMM|nr:AraC family transcriptional regulator [Thalassotalea loyana]GLX83914.1 AraC family transcriptional regulator [Thalassotalea loyana]